jgi:hypothetical protein
MSVFNEDYKNDKQLEAENREKHRKVGIKNREIKNKLAQDIFLAVIDEIDKNHTDHFSKKDMVELVAGSSKKTEIEWFVWNNAANIAIQRLRRYYWTDRKDVMERILFNYDHQSGCYWLVETTDELMTNRIYEQYNRKMLGLNKKQVQIAKSAYQAVLELDPTKRNELIERMRRENLINGK